MSLLLPSSWVLVTTPEGGKKICSWETIGPDAETAEEMAQESVSQPALSQSEIHAFVTRDD